MKAPTQTKSLSLQTIDVDIRVQATADKVHRALTDASELTRWWATHAVSDPRPGGYFRLDWEFRQQTERNHSQSGAYAAVEPGKRIVMPWIAPGQDAVSIVEWLITAEGPQTHLRLRHHGWDPANKKGIEHHRMGWQMFTQNLKSVLEGGPDQREKVLGMVCVV